MGMDGCMLGCHICWPYCLLWPRARLWRAPRVVDAESCVCLLRIAVACLTPECKYDGGDCETSTPNEVRDSFARSTSCPPRSVSCSSLRQPRRSLAANTYFALAATFTNHLLLSTEVRTVAY